jgi:E3 ubiquitin-protein ligase AMFR
MIFWLRGMAFHLVDTVLLLNLRVSGAYALINAGYVQGNILIFYLKFQALIVSFLKRIKTYIKLRKALSSLDGALPDATYDEICAYDDECAICRVTNLPCLEIRCGG